MPWIPFYKNSLIRPEFFLSICLCKVVSLLIFHYFLLTTGYMPLKKDVSAEKKSDKFVLIRDKMEIIVIVNVFFPYTIILIQIFLLLSTLFCFNQIILLSFVFFSHNQIHVNVCLNLEVLFAEN